MEYTKVFMNQIKMKLMIKDNKKTTKPITFKCLIQFQIHYKVLLKTNI